MIENNKIYCDVCNIRLYKSKKEHYKCKDCGKDLCGKHAYSYVDESNIAITNNSPHCCRECYIKRYKR